MNQKSEEKELLNEPWSYEYKVTHYDKHGKTCAECDRYRSKITHYIYFKGKMVSRTNGTQEIEGARCKKIVQRGNSENLTPDLSVCGADFGGTAESRISRVNKAVEKAELLMSKWLKRNNATRSVKFFEPAKVTVSGKTYEAENLGDAISLASKDQNLTDWRFL